MITELFSMLSSIDVSQGKGKAKTLSINMNRNRIRSISAYSSNSIFYFPVATSDQTTPEEMAMVGRMIEKSYASFVVACISLMPFHRIRADDQASIEEYLSQFHQNLGISPGSGAIMSKVLGMVDTLEESTCTPDEIAAAQKFLLECWERSRKNCTNFIKIVNETVSLNDMYNIPAVDPVTKVIQEQWMARQEELDEWGFLGDATPDMLDGNDDDLADKSDDEILNDIFGEEGEFPDPEDEDGDALGDESVESLTEASFSDNYAKVEKVISDNRLKMFGTSGPIEDLTIVMKLTSLIKSATTEAELNKAATACRSFNFGHINTTQQASFDKEIEKQRQKIQESKKTKEKPITEGTVKSAIDSIMFSLESVSENKILSCSSLSKLSSLEAKLNKLKNKYAKYLTRYKRKHKENKAKGSDSKLSIRFNGLSISNPKAFMKQYGAYIKIINKRLKLVERRRAELRKRKGIKDTPKEKIEENALTSLTDMDFQAIDYCIKTIDESLGAPDDEVFILTEASRDYTPEDQINDLQADMADLFVQKKDLEKRVNIAEKRANSAQQTAATAKRNQQAAWDQQSAKTQEADRYKKQFGTVTKKNKELEKKVKELEKNKSVGAPTSGYTGGSAYPPKGQYGYVGRPNPKDMDGPADIQIGDNDMYITYDRSRPRGGINVARAAANGQRNFSTFDKEVFTNMDMKKSNEAVPTFTRASIGFIVDETEEVVTRDVLIGIKAYIHKVAAADMISDIYNCIINKRKFLKFVKFISGEEKSLADLLFGIKSLKSDALQSRDGSMGQWAAAFRRRKRWSKISVPYLMKEYTPNGTVVITMNEVQFIRDEYGIDIMTPDHVNMIMDYSFLLGFVVLDQANEMCYVTYDGHGGNFQQYTYSMLERESNQSDRAMRELYRAMAR